MICAPRPQNCIVMAYRSDYGSPYTRVDLRARRDARARARAAVARGPPRAGPSQRMLASS
jgi:hypothetical protein